MKPIVVSYPWQMISIDIAGPYPETPSSNYHLLTIVDAFSGFAVTAAMKKQTAEVVCNIIMEKIVAPFGCPIAILSDQGRQFEGKIFTQLCDMLEIEKKRTVSYHPQTNGKNERIHRTLNNMFRSLPKDGTWERYLPLLTLTYNSAPGASTGMSPYKILFGRNPYMPCDLILPEPPQKFMPQNKYIKILHDAIEATRQTAEQNLQIKQEVMKKQYDKKIRKNEYEVGEKVMMLHVPKLGEHRKMAPRWEGPFTILRQSNDVNFELQLGNRRKTVHHNQIKKYFSPSELATEKLLREPLLHQYRYLEDEIDEDTPALNMPYIPQCHELPPIEQQVHLNSDEVASRVESHDVITEGHDVIREDQPIIEPEKVDDVVIRKSHRTKLPRTTYEASSGNTVALETTPVFEQQLTVVKRSKTLEEIVTKSFRNIIKLLKPRYKHRNRYKKRNKKIKKQYSKVKSAVNKELLNKNDHALPCIQLSAILIKNKVDEKNELKQLKTTKNSAKSQVVTNKSEIKQIKQLKLNKNSAVLPILKLSQVVANKNEIKHFKQIKYNKNSAVLPILKLSQVGINKKEIKQLKTNNNSAELPIFLNKNNNNNNNKTKNDTMPASAIKMLRQILNSHRRAEVLIYGPENEIMPHKKGTYRSEERRVGKECRSRWSPYH
jgi:hypothetical protein